MVLLLFHMKSDDEQTKNNKKERQKDLILLLLDGIDYLAYEPIRRGDENVNFRNDPKNYFRKGL